MIKFSGKWQKWSTLCYKGDTNFKAIDIENVQTQKTAQKQSPRCVLWKRCFRNFTKFTGKHLYQSLFLIKFQKAPATLLKKGLWYRCFPVNFAKFLRTPFFTEHHRWLLLTVMKIRLSQEDSFKWILTPAISFGVPV